LIDPTVFHPALLKKRRWHRRGVEITGQNRKK
jgi:hypothetical protein